MNAVLQPITVRPIIRPTYRNDRIRQPADWYRDNLRLLADYHADLSRQGPMPDLWMFAMLQRDVEDIKALEADSDPTPWCSYGHRTKESCDCGPIAENE